MKYLLSLIILITLVACTESITYEISSQHYTSEDYEVCKTQQCPVVDLTLITLHKPDRLKATVNNWIQELTLQELNLLVDQDNTNVEEAIKEYLNTSQIGYPETSVLSDAHELTIDTALSFSSDELLSVVFYSYQFSGGASGFDSVKYINLNPQTGEEFTMDMLVDESFYAFAKAQLEKQFPNIAIETETNKDAIKELGFNQEGIIVIFNDTTAVALNDNQGQLLISWEEADDYLIF